MTPKYPSNKLTVVFRDKGPAVDCTGRTSEDCRQDRALNAEMKRLWNEQTPNDQHNRPASAGPG